MRPLAPLLLVVLCAAVLAAPAVVWGEEFRVESEIYVGDADEPVVENLTLFANDVVYDFMLTEPEEITVLDTKRNRLILLDPARRLQSVLTTDEIAKFVAAMKAHKAEGDLAFLLHPEFEVEFDEEDGWLTLASKPLTYRARGIEPKFSDAAKRYRLFADWCARFNATRPGNLPPFARLELNRSLAEEGLIPSQVERTLRLSKSAAGGAQEARSQHWAVWRLSNRDRERIEEVSRYQASFELVSLEDYRDHREAAESSEKK